MAAAAAAAAEGELERPVQLIRISEDGKCHLEEEASAIIHECHGRLAVVGIAGLYRTGKSFLLNRLLGRQSGFEVGPTVNPCTKGIWMWGRPVKLAPNYHCLLIDTEGLGSAQRTTSCDMQIFSLCLLLSSYFVYNSMGAIDEQAIEDLHLVLNLARHIHVRSGSQEEGKKAEEREGELAKSLPSFLWVLRDFHLRLVDEHGTKITARDYLENALRPVPEEETRSTVRAAVRELFPQRDCTTLVRPVAEEADLRHVEKLPYESLRPDFRAQVEAFVNKVFAALKPKQVGNSVVSGPMFVNLAQEYCQAINKSAVPTIQSAWTSAVQHQLRNCLRDAVHEYTRHMEEEVLNRLPLSEAQLQDCHRAAEAEAFRRFGEPGFDEADPKFLEYREELASRMGRLRESAEADNAEASRRQCQAVAEELYEQMIQARLGSRGSYSFDALAGDWSLLRTEYLQRTAGPAQAEVLGTWLMERMTESMQRVHDQLKGQADTDAEEKCGSLQQAHTAALEQERAMLHQSLEEAKQRWLEEREALERKLEAEQEPCEGTARGRALGQAEEDNEVPWRRTRPLPPLLKEGRAPLPPPAESPPNASSPFFWASPSRPPPSTSKLAPPAAVRSAWAEAQASTPSDASGPLPTRTLEGCAAPAAKKRAGRRSVGGREDLASVATTLELGRPSELSQMSCRTVEPEFSSAMTLPISVGSWKELPGAALAPKSRGTWPAPEPSKPSPLDTHSAADLVAAEAEERAPVVELSSPPVRQQCGATLCSLQ